MSSLERLSLSPKLELYLHAFLSLLSDLAEGCLMLLGAVSGSSWSLERELSESLISFQPDLRVLYLS